MLCKIWIGSLWALLLLACSSEPSGRLLSPAYVDLRGKPALTIIRNATQDTLALEGAFFTYLPYTETPFTLSIPPGQQDTLTFDFAYPDFIYLFSPEYLRVLNAPGGELTCTIEKLDSELTKISFAGDWADINRYYLAYHNRLGSSYEQNRPYFILGNTISDFERFPLLADSISQRSLSFLESYPEELPDWFTTHERWRLKYLAGFLKYNVHLTKEFYSRRKIPVTEAYFSFEEDLPVDNDEVILNTEFLWYCHFFIERRSKDIEPPGDRELYVIDSLFMERPVADILRMQRLGHLYKGRSKGAYDSLLVKVTFNNAEVKQVLDSLVNAKYGLPSFGRRVPDISLVDSYGREASLESYRGSLIIVNFWATWCGPCISEFPAEEKLFRKYRERGLMVVNICVDSEFDRWKKILDGAGRETVNLFSPLSNYAAVSKNFGIHGLPKSILIDRQLRVIDNDFQRASLLKDSDMEEVLGRDNL